ncbi:MAG: prepilin-type N-terminal cleavage/methylation domain-containing protein [Pseudomonadota bacterium]
MDRKFQESSAFTLIEILIVIIVLGILAMIILPQINVATDEAKLNILKTNLERLRLSIDYYAYQHNNIYPEYHDKTGKVETDAEKAAEVFVWQLTQYTDVTGKVSTSIHWKYPYGPYITQGKMPTNPFNNKDDVMCDITTTDPKVKTSDGTTGLKFYTRTGVLLPNDGDHDDL